MVPSNQECLKSCWSPKHADHFATNLKRISREIGVSSAPWCYKRKSNPLISKLLSTVDSKVTKLNKCQRAPQGIRFYRRARKKEEGGRQKKEGEGGNRTCKWNDRIRDTSKQGEEEVMWKPRGFSALQNHFLNFILVGSIVKQKSAFTFEVCKILVNDN